MGVVINLDTLSHLKGKANIGLCHGVFDVLHDGHLNYFQEARSLCDWLVVSITPDIYVNKGPGRPYFSEQARARMLSALQIVDYVVINNEPKATNVIKALSPAFYIKGSDYKDRDSDLTKGILEEEEAVKSAGGKIVFTSGPTNSSSRIINTVYNSFSDEQNKTIQKVKELGGIDLIHKIFNEISKTAVTVIGEPIVDTYIFCEPEGISSKSPTISARHISREDYAGGSLAIANHLVDFVRTVHLCAPHGRELYFQDIKKNLVDKRVVYHESMFPNYTTPRKTRFLDKDKNQRMFEITDINPHIWDTNDMRPFLSRVRSLSEDAYVTMFCDFGHGLFENGFLSNCFDIGTFRALNCQTNSSNFGFNPYTKHKDFHYLSIDLKEARVAFHDKVSTCHNLFDKIDVPSVSMTLGPGGALYKDKESHVECPAFADKVVDAIGAGDAYYAMTSLLVRAKAPAELIPFIGNVFAGLKTKIIGNKHSVTKAQLIKALTAVLK